MKSNTSIKQREITIEVDSQKIIVRRMSWKAARAFLRKLAGHITKMGGNLADNLQRIPEIVAGADELAADLMVNSTDLTAEDLDKLDVAQVVAILEAAVELNLGAELKNSLAGIASNLGDLKPAMTTSTGA